MTSFSSLAHNYPKVGPNRELKKVLEAFWRGEKTKQALKDAANTIEIDRVKKMQAAGIDQIVSNDFALYDVMLNHSLLFGVVPKRFAAIEDELDLYFAMARGSKEAVACEMTKWFDTNYHYIVPELSGSFHVKTNSVLSNYERIKSETAAETTPVMIGPFTYLALSKWEESQSPALSNREKFKVALTQLSREYNRILKECEAAGVRTVQLDEPSWVMDRTEEDVSDVVAAYKILTEGLSSLKITFNTYYESLSCFQSLTAALPVHAIGLDFVCNEENLNAIRSVGFPEDKELVCGVISGRDPWRTDLSQVKTLVETISGLVSKSSLVLSNAAPLFHLPHTIDDERGHIEDDVVSLLAFADQRLGELAELKQVMEGKAIENVVDIQAIQKKFEKQAVKAKVAGLDESGIGRKADFDARYELQRKALNLPDFPTTTIGSFPQTTEVRQKRLQYKTGEISAQDYEQYINSEIEKVVALQEKIGLDVLVHGEFERTDMVEFFGQKMDGFAFSRNGWVQSYGSRCVRPPIIYADVLRPEPMTIRETVYAQKLTEKSMKGMLTGPVTILNWSFYRKDISKKEISYQIAFALEDEVMDLEENGIKIIQIDEPAFREGLPLKAAKQKDYLDWAVSSFKLTHSRVSDDTQIHTHMCYSEFNEIIDSIQAMDADVISIETSRSRGEIIEAFEKFNYRNGIGLGVYDIHSPRVPSTEEMQEIVDRSLKVIDKRLIWINPDCGLKTRKEPETVAALEKMVAVAKQLKEAVQV